MAGLVDAVDAWCREHQISPANGQAADQLSERTVRYYRTLGLLDPGGIGVYTKAKLGIPRGDFDGANYVLEQKAS